MWRYEQNVNARYLKNYLQLKIIIEQNYFPIYIYYPFLEYCLSMHNVL